MTRLTAVVAVIVTVGLVVFFFADSTRDGGDVPVGPEARSTTTSLANASLPNTESTNASSATDPDPPGAIWSTGYEDGTTDAWTNVAISGTGNTDVVNSPVRSGRYANSLTVDGSAGVRMVWKNHANADESQTYNLPVDAYYSAWYLIPTPVEVDWWVIHEWKQQQDCTGSVLYAISLFNDPEGTLEFWLTSNVNTSGEWEDQTNRFWDSDVAVPIGRWFNITTRYRWDENGRGLVEGWLDETTHLFAVDDVTTAFDWPHCAYSKQWVVANYNANPEPSMHTLYVDDVVVFEP